MEVHEPKTGDRERLGRDDLSIRNNNRNIRPQSTERIRELEFCRWLVHGDVVCCSPLGDGWRCWRVRSSG